MAGNMKFIEEEFEKKLQRRELKQKTIDKCDVIVVFCPIVSRAGTDISTALSQLDNAKVDKQVILVVLHHTFDPNKTIPDSNAAVDREKTFAVDCLFYEDTGLLQCQRNEDAANEIAEYLKSQKLTSYTCFKGIQASSLQSTDHEDSLLFNSKPSTPWWRSKKIVFVAVGSVVIVAGGFILYLCLH